MTKSARAATLTKGNRCKSKKPVKARSQMLRSPPLKLLNLLTKRGGSAIYSNPLLHRNAISRAARKPAE